jgi:biopolymer transport protein ExbD
VNFQRGRGREPLEINLVPLIDVMMVIIIFLMITTTYSRYTELQINLPSAAEAEKQPERANEVSVLVNAQGQYVVNRRAVAFRSVEQLAEELRRAAGGAKEPMVVISADANATHQAVIRVMEAARLAGLSQITFTTQSAK